MNLELDNKVILVTGGGKGIGEGIVKVLAQENAIPVIIGRNTGDNEALVRSLEKENNRAYAIAAELTDPVACARAVEQVVQMLGRIDGLVNNAGVNDGVGLENGSYEDFMASLHRNVVHYYLMAHYALPWLKESKGPLEQVRVELLVMLLPMGPAMRLPGNGR
jgi:L-fucose dehydrogenase